MHSATVESYLSICNAKRTRETTSSTREFDTCQTKRCCSRVPYFRRSNGVRPYEGFLSVRCSNLKENRGWGARQSTARIFEFLLGLTRTYRPQLSFIQRTVGRKFGCRSGRREITRHHKGEALLITPSPFLESLARTVATL